MSLQPVSHTVEVGEIRNVSIDMRGKLDAGELVTGIPTIAEITTTDLSFANNAFNTGDVTINGSVCATGQAVLFKVSGFLSGVKYRIRVTATTTATPAQTLIEYVVIKTLE